MKQKVRLTEGDLHKIVESSVKKLIREYGLDYIHPFNDMAMDQDIERIQRDSKKPHEQEPEKKPDGTKKRKGFLKRIFGESAMMDRIIKESINKVLQETSDEKVARAEDTAKLKVMDAEEEYGPNSAVAQRAREQQKYFTNALSDRYSKGNLSRKARIEKARKKAKEDNAI